MLKIGLAGGIGSGKSTASAILGELGSYIFDADTEAKIILNDNENVHNDIVSEFGNDVLDQSGKIDRKKLAKVAFQDEDHQIILNSIIHPFVFKELDNQFNKISSQNKHASFIVDGALIFESGLDQHLDSVLFIASLLKFRIGRALKRGNLSREEILKRIDLQWTDEQKAEMADYIIYNNGTEKELEEKIREFHEKHIYR
ncbi:MAG: dephospho-CoA kinase [Candidatus Neomarinimicrobiota bacterium]